MNNRFLLILAAVVAAIVLGALAILNMGPTSPVVTTAATPTPAPESSIPRTGSDFSSSRSDRTTSADTTQTEAPPRPAPEPIQPWEKKLDEVLSSSADESQTAQILINLFPGLPPDGQAEYAEHISNLIEDKDYNKVLPLVKNPSVSEEALDVFVTDLVNREDATKLPALLEIAKVPNHPHKQEALDDLELFLDEDHGTDWNKWTAGVQDYLKKQAAEEAEDEAGTKVPSVPPQPLTQ
jgi:hypothetical protein